MAARTNPIVDDLFNPVEWAQIARCSASIDEARSRISDRIGQVIHVNSLLLVVGGKLPKAYRPGLGLRMAHTSAEHVSGELVSNDWMTFLWKDGNAQDDPMVRRLGRNTKPPFGGKNPTCIAHYADKNANSRDTTLIIAFAMAYWMPT